MKRFLIPLLLLLLLLAGCGGEEATPTTQLANPWSDRSSPEEAEAAVGFSFGLPRTVGNYEAVTFRTMNGELLEITYLFEDSEVCVRKQMGEAGDISGDYNTYETEETWEAKGYTVTLCSNADTPGKKVLVIGKDHCWSLTAPSGFAENGQQAFLDAILNP